MFASGKGRQQVGTTAKVSREQCIDHIPYYLSGLSEAYFFVQPFSKELYGKKVFPDSLDIPAFSSIRASCSWSVFILFYLPPNNRN